MGGSIYMSSISRIYLTRMLYIVLSFLFLEVVMLVNLMHNINKVKKRHTLLEISTELSSGISFVIGIH